MFPTTDRTRRHLGVALFFTLCIFPTLAVLGGSLWLARPAHVEDCQRELSRRLGLAVKLEQVTYPLPGVTLLAGFTVADPETGEQLLSTRLLEVHKNGNTWHVKAEQPEVPAGAVVRLRDWLDRLLRSPEADHPRVVLVAGDVTFHDGDHSQTFTDVSGWYEPLPAGARAGARFRLAGEADAELASVELTRNRQTSPPATRIELKAPTPLPCEFVGAGADWKQWVGGGSTFRGLLIWTNSGQGWEADIRGLLSGVDLYRLVSGRFPHQLSGLSDVALTRVRIRDGRLEEAEGQLAAGPGVVSGSLLIALAESLGMPLAEDSPALHPAGREPAAGALAWPSPDQIFQYEQLSLKFKAAARQLDLRGGIPQSPGVVFLAPRGPLLREPANVQPVTGLVRALVPSNGVEVPLTRETDLLLGLLPVGKTTVASPMPPAGTNRLRVTPE